MQSIEVNCQVNRNSEPSDFFLYACVCYSGGPFNIHIGYNKPKNLVLKPTSTYISSQAVDVIGKAGTPKTIAGSHTHTTPVLLSFGERAELATDEYIPLSPVMEGFVILKKNEDSVMASVQ